MTQITALQLDPADDVATLLAEGEPGARISLSGGAAADLVLRDRVPFGHKVAVRDLAPGTPVHKHGVAIGVVTRAVATGEHVHEHNLRSLRNGPRA